MKHIFNETQLENALNSGEREVILHGEIAEKFARQVKAKRRAKTGGILLAIGGIIAAPLTGGLSLPGAIAGITVGTISMSTAELAILAGCVVACTAAKNGYDVQLNSDGTVILKKK